MAEQDSTDELIEQSQDGQMHTHTTESPAYEAHSRNEANEPLSSYANRTSDAHLRDTDPEISFAPAYTERPDPVVTLENALARNTEHIQDLDLSAWLTYISSPYREDKLKSPDRSSLVNNQLIKCFFTSISNGHEEAIRLVLSEGIVSANTTLRAGMWNTHFDKDPELIGETPLIRAVKTRNLGMVKLLLEQGAEVDTFGCTEEHDEADERVVRTALQISASMGHIVIVKLLMEQYHANDALVAPDGQIALRLAADNGHAEIVVYLPSKRAGGYRRWKFKNRKSIDRVKHAGVRIYKFVKFFIWDVEKFMFWTVPKELVGRRIFNGLKWCWMNKSHLGFWLRKELSLVPGRLRAFGRLLLKLPKALWNSLRKILDIIWIFIVKASKAIWTFATKMFPGLVKDSGVWFWKFLTVSIPKASVLVSKWIWNGVVSLAKGSWHIILKIISFFSTIFEAIISFFQRLTLTDVWNGFIEVLRSIFVFFPLKIWSWIESLGEVNYKVMKGLFGFVGQMFWWIGFVSVWVVIFVPRQICVVLQSIGGILWRAGHEIRVFCDPKTR